MNRTIQWLNSNKYRKYPFIEDLPLKFDAADGSGLTIVLADDVILDCQFVTYRHYVGPVWLHSISAELLPHGLKEVKFSFIVGDVPVTITVPAHVVSTYTSTLSSNDFTITCVFGPGVSGLADDILANKSQYTWWNPAQPVQFEPALTSVQNKHRVISLWGDTAGSVPVSGHVFWEEGFGTRIDLDLTSNSIRLNAIPGAGAGFPCRRAQPGRADCSDVLFSVNGVHGDGLGRISLVGSLGLSIIPEPSRHRITIQTNVTAADIECGKQ